jgi:hypothetical protein
VLLKIKLLVWTFRWIWALGGPLGKSPIVAARKQI